MEPVDETLPRLIIQDDRDPSRRHILRGSQEVLNQVERSIAARRDIRALQEALSVAGRINRKSCRFQDSVTATPYDVHGTEEAVAALERILSLYSCMEQDLESLIPANDSPQREQRTSLIAMKRIWELEGALQEVTVLADNRMSEIIHLKVDKNFAEGRVASLEASLTEAIQSMFREALRASDIEDLRAQERERCARLALQWFYRLYPFVFDEEGFKAHLASGGTA